MICSSCGTVCPYRFIRAVMRSSETTKPRKGLPSRLWVAQGGFEPPTFGLWARRATRLLHRVAQ